MNGEEIENCPVLIGTLKIKTGLNGFEEALPGHPVFELKDRYLIFLKSLHKTMEQVPTGNGGHEKKMTDYNVIIPYYKKTLAPHIDFTPISN